LLESGEPDHPPSGAGSAAANPASAALLPSYLPCEIETLVRTRCKSCHAPGSPLHQASLLTQMDFVRPAPSAPGLNYAQRALQLVASGMMPPTASLPTADVQALAAWVQAGAPAVVCGGAASDAGSDAGVAIAHDAGLLYDAGFDFGAREGANTDAAIGYDAATRWPP
jgi:hypothetical protein